MPPTIGITCDFETYTSRRGISLERHLCSFELVDHIVKAGGRPLLLPHVSEASSAILSMDGLDGLILSGGDFDPPPALYHQAPHAKLGRLRPARTHSELTLLKQAEQLCLPILGLCGGMQLLNVARGGSLFQDISLRPDSDVHEQPGDTRAPSHRVVLNEHGRLAHIVGQTDIEVNSTHHQVIDRVGDDLEVAGRAPDGVIEAIEARDRHEWIIGVQWHPEMLAQQSSKALFRDFIGACSRR